MRTSDRIAALSIVIVAAGASLLPRPSAAEGALAVGLPRDVAAEGFAFGYALNMGSVEAARAEAMRVCKNPSPGVDKRAQALCAVVHAFRDQCFAVAMDPEDATPGVGWAVAASKTTATQDALVKCRDTAGEDRRDACVISRAECDGQAR